MKIMLKTTLGAALVAAAYAPVAAQASEFARVLSATPVTASVAVPNRVCNEEQQLVGARPSGAGAVIGAIAGGVLGNQIGHGFGRAAATGIGAVVGSAIGNGVEVNAANAYPATAVPVQRCQTVSAYENRTIGYDVVYEYAGRRYTTRTARDPGPEIEIDVRPVGAVAESAPPARYLDVPPPPRGVYAPAPVVAPAPVYAPGPVIYVGPSVGYYGGYYVGPRHHRWY